MKLLLIKQLVGESNRMFSNMLVIFSMVSGIDVSYKSVERLYSDQEVILAIHNLHILILKNKGIGSSDATGDGTGYSLTIKKNYESYVQKLKDKTKENSNESNRKGRSGRRRPLCILILHDGSEDEDVCGIRFFDEVGEGCIREGNWNAQINRNNS